jgi:hypothetical protein
MFEKILDKLLIALFNLFTYGLCKEGDAVA